MLVAFSVKNYKSFKDEVLFNLVASGISGHEDANLVSTSEKLKLLKTSVIYGANASGKSNLRKALQFVQAFVLNSAKETQVAQKIAAEPFRLSTETEKEPSRFEVIFIYEGVKYRYGFEVYTEKVHKEWLFYTPKSTEIKLFERKGQSFDVSYRFKEAKKVYQEGTRPNALFLSVLANWNGEISQRILQWFSKFIVISAVEDANYMNFAHAKLQDREYQNQVLRLLRSIDIGVENLLVESYPATPDNFPKEVPEVIKQFILSQDTATHTTMKTEHVKYDKNNSPAALEQFDFVQNESDGTIKFTFLAVLLIEALKQGTPLFIDELDVRFHPLITRFILDLFHSKANNPKSAQLIFSTHNTNILNTNIFRRDQIWFTEKDKYGASTLLSLDEFKVRKDASFEKSYLSGDYGAIPYIKKGEKLISES